MTLSLARPETRATPLSTIDPRARLAAGIVCVGLTAALADLQASGIALVLAAFLVAIARLPGRWLAQRLAALAIGVAPFAVLMPILGGAAGARLAALIGLKCFAIAGIALALFGTMSAGDAARAAASLGMPRRVVEIALLSHRFLFVLGDEFRTMRTAVQVRGFRTGTNVRSFQTAGAMLGMVLMRAADRGDRIAHALRCRGSDGRFRSLTTQRFGWRDAAMLIAIVTPFVALLVFDRR